MNNIYYFTGTGNSLQIAEDLAEKIGDCIIEKIAGYDGKKVDGKVLCIVYPVYNWGIPLIIRDFLNKLNVSEDTMIYAVANCGGLPGRALDMADDILRSRGRKLRGGFIIKMPGNYIIGYGAPSEKDQKKAFAKEKERVNYIAQCINNKKILPIEKSHFLVDRLFTNHFYKDVPGFHEDDKNFIVSDKCISCGLCAKRCPVGNITIKDGKPQWNHNCELCMACLQSCPKEAINYGHKTVGRKRYLNPNVKIG